MKSDRSKSLHVPAAVVIAGLIALSELACTDNNAGKPQRPPDTDKVSPITRQEINQAQKAWGEGVVAIGKTYTAGGDYKKTAEEHVDTLYAYDMGPVLFCPTKASQQQFRLTREGAISYFVGGDPNFPEDKGFALQPWSKVRFENVGEFLHGDYAVAMGNYYFTPADGGEEVKVEYTFGYIKDEDGELRINVHHSSLPYNEKD